MGPVDQVKGLYLASGFEGEGIMLAPIVGTLISELITEGTTSCLIHEYRLSRFSNSKEVRD
jgi:glycine/D-amino acid oxidase-like deaminating enzyme